MNQPQSPRSKDQQSHQGPVSVGDEVITTSGIYGFITGEDDDKFWLEIDDDVQIRIARTAVQARVNRSGSDAVEAVDVPSDEAANDFTSVEEIPGPVAERAEVTRSLIVAEDFIVPAHSIDHRDFARFGAEWLSEHQGDTLPVYEALSSWALMLSTIEEESGPEAGIEIFEWVTEYTRLSWNSDHDLTIAMYNPDLREMITEAIEAAGNGQIHVVLARTPNDMRLRGMWVGAIAAFLRASSNFEWKGVALDKRLLQTHSLRSRDG